MESPEDGSGGPSVKLLKGAAMIQGIRDVDRQYRAFDAYPWTKDPSFMAGYPVRLSDPRRGQFIPSCPCYTSYEP